MNCQNDDRRGTPRELYQFPDIMNGLAGDFAHLYSSYLEVPPHFFFMSFLTCLGTVLSKALTSASEIRPQPRLYTVLLGQSADDRKSTAINKTVGFFKDAVEDFSVCWGIGSAEGLQKRLNEKGRLLLCFDEFKQFVSKCRIDTSILLPCVNTLFESNRYESRTKKTEIYLDAAYLSLLGASTIQTYERTWDSSFTDIGFNNRLFLVPGTGRRKHSFPAKIPVKKIRALKDRLREVLRHVGSGLELDISPFAREIYHEWYMNLENSVHTKRLDTYAMRLMQLLSVNGLHKEIDEITVKETIELCDWQLQVRRTHDPIDADNEIAKMEERFRRILSGGPRTERELKQRTHYNRTGIWMYETAKKNLQNAGEIRLNKKMKAWEMVR